MSRLVSLLFLLQATANNAFFSINYSAEENHPALMTSPVVFKEAPNAEQVADIYARLSGISPLLSEGTMNLPSIDILADHSQKPLLIEIHGGRLPGSVKSVVKSAAFEGGAKGPTMQSVVSILNERGIEVESQTVKADENLNEDLIQFLHSQSRPVVIMHHETPTAAHFIQRNLASAYGNGGNGMGNTTLVKPLDEYQISQYQICLWTGVGMVLLVLTSVCMIVQMEVLPDSLLYAKFQSARTHKND